MTAKVMKVVSISGFYVFVPCADPLCLLCRNFVKIGTRYESEIGWYCRFCVELVTDLPHGDADMDGLLHLVHECAMAHEVSKYDYLEILTMVKG